jgi:TatA/E family protein of Tat protein translocase
MLAFISDTGIVVAVIAFVALFGASHIPKLARNLGEAGKEFRQARTEFETSGSAVTATPAAVPVGAPDDRVTLTRAQLDELVANRNALADRAL